MGPGGGFGLQKYMRDILAARNAGSDKRYEADQAQQAKQAADLDTQREMGRAALELAVKAQPRKLPGADNPFWAKPAEYRQAPKASQGYYEVPHTMGAVGPVAPSAPEKKRSYEEQLVYDMKGAAADPNVQEKAEREGKLTSLAAFFGNQAAAAQTLPSDPDAPSVPKRARGIR